MKESWREKGTSTPFPENINYKRTEQRNAPQEAMAFAGHVKAETTMLYCETDQESVKYHHRKHLSA